MSFTLLFFFVVKDEEVEDVAGGETIVVCLQERFSCRCCSLSVGRDARGPCEVLYVMFEAEDPCCVALL